MPRGYYVPPETDAILWRRWAILSAIALVVFLGFIGLGGYGSAVLLGWVAGVVIAACAILVRRRH